MVWFLSCGLYCLWLVIWLVLVVGGFGFCLVACFVLGVVVAVLSYLTLPVLSILSLSLSDSSVRSVRLSYLVFALF